MDDRFNLDAARKADDQYGRMTDAEFISDEKAFTRSYGFAAHTSARHLHAALAHIAELEAERDQIGLAISGQVLEAARLQGYGRAVARLRDEERKAAWFRERVIAESRATGERPWPPEQWPPSEEYARYLEATKETP